MLRFFALLIVGLLLIGCQPAVTPTESVASPVPSSAGRPDGGRLPVVATSSIIADLVRNVGGDRVEVMTLVGAGADAHTFEPSPADGVALARAALVFENGLGMEPWLDDLHASSGSAAVRVVVTNGITPLPIDKADGHAGAEAADHADHAAGEFDPHAWHDVERASQMVGVIRDALAQADPSGADSYRENAERYQIELAQLDDWIRMQVESLPEPRRKLVTTHDTFGYFAHAYGFEVVGTALGSTSTEAAEPSAAEIVRLIDRIRSAGVPVVFAENVNNPRLIERIAAEAGVEVGPTLYTDALGEPGSDGDSYVNMMRYNVTTIVTALQAD